MKQVLHYGIGAILLVTSLQFAFANEASPSHTFPTNLEPLEYLPPPQISTDNSVDEPEITIVKKNGETVEEYRLGGELYLMKITPAHGTPYYLHKEDQNGGWVNVGPNPPLSVPKWVIFKW